MSENTNEITEKVVSAERRPLPDVSGRGESNIAQQMYFAGDRVMHVDGRIGVVVNSGYMNPDDADYGKKWLVRPERKREVWGKSDLDKKYAPVMNQTVHKIDGTKGSVAGFVEGGVMVWPIREEKDELWRPSDFAGFADAQIQERVAADYQRQVDDLQGQVDRLEMANEALVLTNPTPIPSPQQQGGEKKIEVKTLVQMLHTMSTVSDRDLADHLNEGWAILDVSVSTMYESLHTLTVVRVVTLRRDAPMIESGNGAKKVEISEVLPPQTGTQEQPIKIDWIDGESADDDSDDDPISDPAALREGVSFAEALRDPDMPVDRLKEIGNIEALLAGRMAFDRRQQTRRPPVPALPFG
jgi:hypothetical protein